MDDLDGNMATWSIFLNTTLQAAVHLGQDYEANLLFVKSHLWNSVGQLFNETGKLISEQTEITGVSTLNFKELTWMWTSFLCKQHTSHVTFFSFTARTCTDVSHDIGSSVCARHPVHVSCA